MEFINNFKNYKLKINKMFICKKCYGEDRDSFFFEIALKSVGSCELCEEHNVCADIHHARLPEKTINFKKSTTKKPKI